METHYGHFYFYFFAFSGVGRGLLLVAVHSVTAVSLAGLCHCGRLSGIANKPIAMLTEEGARPLLPGGLLIHTVGCHCNIYPN